jgi:hypothetical protein
MEGGHHQRLLDAVLIGLAGFLDDNRSTFRTRLEQESPWWVPEPIDDKIFEKIFTAVHRFLDDVGTTATTRCGGRSTRRCCSSPTGSPTTRR